jgi:hypothetical protein
MSATGERTTGPEWKVVGQSSDTAPSDSRWRFIFAPDWAKQKCSSRLTTAAGTAKGESQETIYRVLSAKRVKRLGTASTAGVCQTNQLR